MPYNAYNVATYSGFHPVLGARGAVQTGVYQVSSSEGAIYLGDCLMLTTIGTVKQNTGSARMVGVAAESMAANAGSTTAAANVKSSQNLLVYDSPDQIFAGCDSSSGIMNWVAVYKNVAVLTSGVVGSTGPSGTTLRSVQALSPVTASSGSGFPFKVIGIHPLEAASTVAHGTAAASTNVRRWLLQPNHILGALADGNITS